jgi:hypothetical protein
LDNEPMAGTRWLVGLLASVVLAAVVLLAGRRTAQDLVGLVGCFGAPLPDGTREPGSRWWCTPSVAVVIATGRMIFLV